jgi:hypothetical protein
VELEGHAAGRSDAFQHRERVPGVFGVLKTGDHGLRGANLLGKFGLSQTRVLSHLADQENQVNLMQGALEGLAVGRTLSRPLLDNLAVPVALGSSLHRPTSFSIASLSPARVVDSNKTDLLTSLLSVVAGRNRRNVLGAIIGPILHGKRSRNVGSANEAISTGRNS